MYSLYTPQSVIAARLRRFDKSFAGDMAGTLMLQGYLWIGCPIISQVSNILRAVSIRVSERTQRNLRDLFNLEIHTKADETSGRYWLTAIPT
jgi:hypothetical protein